VTAGICCGDTWLFHIDASSGASTLISLTDPPKPCLGLCRASGANRVPDTSTPADLP
jgi:hypothetical protein